QTTAGRPSKPLPSRIFWREDAFETHEPMSPLELVKLPPLMNRTAGRAEIAVALIDGPVAVGSPEFSTGKIKDITGKGGACVWANSAACMHGTFVAGILSANRGSAAPAICPNCTLLVRPIFYEAQTRPGEVPIATPEELADAIVESVE